MRTPRWITLSALIVPTLGLYACNHDDGDPEEEVDVTLDGGALEEGADELGECVNACTADAETCRAGCTDATCAATCDADFTACERACDQLGE